MSAKKILMCVGVFAWLLSSTAAFSQAEEKIQPVDVLQRIIQLAVENNPILESQRSL
ncbi:unnamed protein product, partial [marine sediment metagenome]